jgi:hypothetical protein
MRYHKLFLARKFAVGEWFKFSRLNVLCNSSIGAFFIKKKIIIIMIFVLILTIQGGQSKPGLSTPKRSAEEDGLNSTRLQ